MSNDVKRLLMVLIPIVIGITIALISTYFLGNDNPVEQEAEEVVDELIEHDLGLPEDSVQLDFTPSKEN